MREFHRLNNFFRLKLVMKQGEGEIKLRINLDGVDVFEGRKSCRVVQICFLRFVFNLKVKGMCFGILKFNRLKLSLISCKSVGKKVL